MRLRPGTDLQHCRRSWRFGGGRVCEAWFRVMDGRNRPFSRANHVRNLTRGMSGRQRWAVEANVGLSTVAVRNGGAEPQTPLPLLRAGTTRMGTWERPARKGSHRRRAYTRPTCCRRPVRCIRECALGLGRCLGIGPFVGAAWAKRSGCALRLCALKSKPRRACFDRIRAVAGCPALRSGACAIPRDPRTHTAAIRFVGAVSAAERGRVRPSAAVGVAFTLRRLRRISWCRRRCGI